MKAKPTNFDGTSQQCVICKRMPRLSSDSKYQENTGDWAYRLSIGVWHRPIPLTPLRTHARRLGIAIGWTSRHLRCIASLRQKCGSWAEAIGSLPCHSLGPAVYKMARLYTTSLHRNGPQQLRSLEDRGMAFLIFWRREGDFISMVGQAGTLFLRVHSFSRSIFP